MSFSFTLLDLPEGNIGVHFKHALEQLVRAHAADLDVQKQHLLPFGSPRGINGRGPQAPKWEPTRPPRGSRDERSAIPTQCSAELNGTRSKIGSDIDSMEKSDAKLAIASKCSTKGLQRGQSSESGLSTNSDGADELEKPVYMGYEASDLDSAQVEDSVQSLPLPSTIIKRVSLPEVTDNDDSNTVSSCMTGRVTCSSQEWVRQSTPDDRLNRLQSLFDRLSPNSMFIDAVRCHEIMVLVLGHKKAPDLEETQQTLIELRGQERASSKDTGYNSRSSLRANDGEAPCDLNILDYDTFVYLMEWERLGLDSPSAEYERTVTIRYLRDSLIKHGADVLIAKYARLNLPTRRSPERHWMLKALEPITGFVIVLNSLCIGLSEEFAWNGWDTFELMFTGFFAAEIAIKISLQGCRGFTLHPKDWAWNWFDLTLVFLAISDAVLQQVAAQSGLSLREFTLARLARLARLTRLMRVLRLLRLRIFKELLLMVRGVVAGLRTLFWAIVLLLVLVYACAVALMQTVGSDEVVIGEGDSATVLFPSLMWSMFNVFRCFMSDGVLVDGTPLVGHLEAKYGALFVMPYTLVTLFIVFGIFNLIAAIFVENVIESAKCKRELSEESDRMRVAQILRSLLFRFTHTELSKSHSKDMDWRRRRSKSRVGNMASGISRKISGGAFDDMEDFFSDTEGHTFFEADGQITRAAFTRAIRDPKTLELLDELDIQISDRQELFDVLDADNSGAIEISEMISGLMKMRSGGADRSDIVATVLGLRAMQTRVQELQHEVQFIYQHLEKQDAKYEDMKESLDGLHRNWQDKKMPPFISSEPRRQVSQSTSSEKSALYYEAVFTAGQTLHRHVGEVSTYTPDEELFDAANKRCMGIPVHEARNKLDLNR